MCITAFTETHKTITDKRKGYIKMRIIPDTATIMTKQVNKQAGFGVD